MQAIAVWAGGWVFGSAEDAVDEREVEESGGEEERDVGETVEEAGNAAEDAAIGKTAMLVDDSHARGVGAGAESVIEREAMNQRTASAGGEEYA